MNPADEKSIRAEIAMLRQQHLVDAARIDMLRRDLRREMGERARLEDVIYTGGTRLRHEQQSIREARAEEDRELVEWQAGSEEAATVDVPWSPEFRAIVESYGGGS